MRDIWSGVNEAPSREKLRVIVVIPHGAEAEKLCSVRDKTNGLKQTR